MTYRFHTCELLHSSPNLYEQASLKLSEVMDDITGKNNICYQSYVRNPGPLLCLVSLGATQLCSSIEQRDKKTYLFYVLDETMDQGKSGRSCFKF